jgi:hypothetical protein
MIGWQHIEARKERLNELAMGFMREAGIMDQHDDPLLFVERRAYLKALRDALAGVETARVVLAHATDWNRRGGT